MRMAGPPGGALLTLPGRVAQADALERLAAGQLSVRPSVDQELMAEYVVRSRLLIDLRNSKPGHRSVLQLPLEPRTKTNIKDFAIYRTVGSLVNSF